MNRLYKALLTVGLTVFSLDCLPAATVTWTDGAGDNLWSSTANWSTNAEPTSADTVVLGSAASGTIFVDTSNPPISNPNVAIQSLNFTNTNGALILNPFFNENFQLSGDTGGNLITNTSGFVQTISLPVFLTGSGVVAGGTGLNIGTLDTDHFHDCQFQHLWNDQRHQRRDQFYGRQHQCPGHALFRRGGRHLPIFQ
jgi:hypothetical protein